MVQQNDLKRFSRLKYARELNTSGLFLHNVKRKHEPTFNNSKLSKLWALSAYHD